MFKTFILIFSLFSFSLSAEIVKRIELNGSDRISLETIKVYGEIEIGKDYSSFDINKITKNLFIYNFLKVDFHFIMLTKSHSGYPWIRQRNLLKV